MSADRPVSRRSCLVAVSLWLCFAIGPCFAIALAMRGELSWKRGNFVEDRVWIVNEAEASGLAYSSARVISAPTDGQVCARTRVYFLLWKGQGENTTYCECYRPAPGGYESTGKCSE